MQEKQFFSYPFIPETIPRSSREHPGSIQSQSRLPESCQKHACRGPGQSPGAGRAGPRTPISADGHTASNAPDLFRPPKLSGAGPGQYWGGGPPGKSLGCCRLFAALPGPRFIGAGQYNAYGASRTMAIRSLVVTFNIRAVSKSPPGTGDFQMMKTAPCQAANAQPNTYDLRVNGTWCTCVALAACSSQTHRVVGHV